MNLYQDTNYAQGRLAGTIVRYDKRPISVVAISGSAVVAVDCITNKEIEFKYTDGKLDINPVPLGYVNNDGLAYYACRCPVRKDWKQGLRSNTLRAIKCGGALASHENLNFANIGKTILGEFPKLKDAINFLNNSWSSVAITRDVAIDHNFSVWLKGQYKVGAYNPAKKKCDVAPDYFWAEEFVQEAFS